MEPIILKYISENLQSNLVDLRQIGVENVAFKFADVEQILNSLEKQKIVILGGDVIELDSKGSPSFTYENWHIEKHLDEPMEDFLKRGYREIKKYIMNITSKSNEPLYFAIVIDDPNNSTYPKHALEK